MNTTHFLYHMTTMPTIRIGPESKWFHTWVMTLLKDILRFHNIQNASLSKSLNKLFIIHVRNNASAAVDIDRNNVLFILLF